MKYFNSVFHLLLLCSVVLFACNKEEINVSDEEPSIEELVPISSSFVKTLQTSVNAASSEINFSAFITVRSSEYITICGTNVTPFLEIGITAKEDSIYQEGELVRHNPSEYGKWEINDVEIQKGTAVVRTEKGSMLDYYEYKPMANYDLPTRNPIDIAAFPGVAEIISGINHQVDMPAALCATSSVGHGDFLPKNSTFSLSWTGDSNYPATYVSLCAEGVACKTKELTQGETSVTYSPSEMSDMPVGSDVWCFLGRGKLDVYTQRTTQAIVGILVVAESQTVRLKVQ